jgi:hypothetical protein
MVFIVTWKYAMFIGLNFIESQSIFQHVYY